MIYTCEVCDQETSYYFTDENGDQISVCDAECQRFYIEIEEQGMFQGADVSDVNVVLREAISDHSAKVVVLSRSGNRHAKVKWIPRYVKNSEAEKQIRKAYLEKLCEEATYGFMEAQGDGNVSIDVFFGGDFDRKKRKVRNPDHVVDLETLLELEAILKLPEEPTRIEGRAGGSSKYWIHIKHPGALTRYAKTHTKSGKPSSKNTIVGKKANHLSEESLREMSVIAHKRHDRHLAGEVAFARNARHFHHSQK